MHVRPAPHLTAIASYPLASLVTGTGRRLCRWHRTKALRTRPISENRCLRGAGFLSLYPDPDCTGLRTSIAAVTASIHSLYYAARVRWADLGCRPRPSRAGDRARPALRLFILPHAAPAIGAAVDLAQKRSYSRCRCHGRCTETRTRVAFVANRNPTGTDRARGSQTPRSTLERSSRYRRGLW